MNNPIALVLACLALAGTAFAQTPPAPPPIDPPPVLDPQSPPIHEDGTPIEPPPVLERQSPPVREDGIPIEPPPVLDPPPAPVRQDEIPIEAQAERSTSGDAAQLQLDQARLQCQTMPEQQRQSCLDAAQRAYELDRRRDDRAR